MKTLLVILLWCYIINVVTARYTNMMPSRLKRDTEDTREEMPKIENDDLSRLPINLESLAKTTDLDKKQPTENDLLVLSPSVNSRSNDEKINLPLIEPKDEDSVEDKLAVVTPKERDIEVEDRLPGFVPPEEVPLGIVVNEPIIVPVEPILPPSIPVPKPVPVIVPEMEPRPPPIVSVAAEPVQPLPFPIKIPLLKEVNVKEPLILEMKPIPPPPVIQEIEPPVVPIVEPVPPPPILEELPPPPPVVPEVKPPPPIVPVIVEPVPPPPPIPEVVPPPPPPLKIPILEEVVFKPPDLNTPFAKGTRWALYLSNMFLKAFSQVLASAQVTIAKFAQLAAP